MNRSTFLRRSLLLAGLAVFGFGLSACGDDDPVAPEPTTSSKVIVMHANPGTSNNVVFKQDVNTLATLGYGTVGTSTVRDGNRTVDVRGLDGSSLGSVGVTLDSTTSTWVLFTGTLTDRAVFKATTKKITPSASSAAVRVIHASHNAGDINLKLNSLNGSPFTTDKISYKGASAYTDLPVSTERLIVVKTSDAATSALEIPLTGQITAGQSYTIVVYGSADAQADPTVKLTSKIVAD